VLPGGGEEDTVSERGTTKPIAGTFFYVLLALADEPRYGLGIAEEIAARTGGDVRLGPGTLYNAIKKMLDGGLIEEWTPPGGEEHDPRRRYYHITRSGRGTLAEEAARLEQLVGAARAKHVLAER
jgi:DNA-binding PadR family transcriptional regulator